ncbi:hypothetical protein HELRODRAFT_179661 [Helobdella robusta]|uniref:Uncharacterized protein n=1 Tax=Helobdella robusta TaxID=6412 RepID=T1FF00_HELRO|nr:hypothetical protein HELRODRAFT_179661 [Helobdella robusta]ESN95077.1 hypothetical protein HELRODRAFT_179661 [Helobdella robusta]
MNVKGLKVTCRNSSNKLIICPSRKDPNSELLTSRNTKRRISLLLKVADELITEKLRMQEEILNKTLLLKQEKTELDFRYVQQRPTQNCGIHTFLFLLLRGQLINLEVEVAPIF